VKDFRTRKKIVQLFVVLFSISTVTTAQTWQHLGVGNVLDLEFHPDSTDKMFFTTASGGLYTSDDYGESIDTILSDIVAYDITFNVTSSDTMYLACASSNNQQSGVLRLVYANGIIESYWSDHGIDLNDDAIVRFIRTIPDTPHIMFASTSTQLGGNLFKSTDFGRNWTIVDLPVDGRVNFIETDPHTPGTIYLGSSSNVLFKSIDYGSTWISLDYGASTDWYPTNLFIHDSDGSVLYLCSQAEGLFKSSDAGSTWNEVSNLPNNSATNLVNDPSVTSMIYVISPYGVYMSDDSGTSWEDYSFNLTGFGSPIKNIYIDPSSHYLFVTPDYFSTFKLNLSTVSVLDNQISLPDRSGIQCFPNPTNGSISIQISSVVDTDYEIKIWDINGRPVYVFERLPEVTGTYVLSWNGKDLKGRKCSSGIYLVTAKSINKLLSQKITLIN